MLGNIVFASGCTALAVSLMRRKVGRFSEVRIPRPVMIIALAYGAIQSAYFAYKAGRQRPATTGRLTTLDEFLRLMSIKVNNGLTATGLNHTYRD